MLTNRCHCPFSGPFAHCGWVRKGLRVREEPPGWSSQFHGKSHHLSHQLLDAACEHSDLGPKGSAVSNDLNVLCLHTVPYHDGAREG